MSVEWVISLGGSVISPKGPDVKFIKEFSSLLPSLNIKAGIVVGGGKYAREYASAVLSLGGSPYLADEVAILETWQNALLLHSSLEESIFVKDFEEAKRLIPTKRFIIMGGTIPGITTDTDAVLLAEALGVKRILNISTVSGVYDRPPEEEGAKKFDEMSLKELERLALEYDKRKPGTHFIFDLFAVKLAQRSGIEIHFVGKDLEDVKNALNLKPHNGTIARP